MFVAELVEREAAGFLDEVAEEDEVDVAVAELRAWRGEWVFLNAEVEGLEIIGGVARPGDAGAEAGGVGEEMAKGDGVAGGAVEFRKVEVDRAIELEFACFDEHHDGGGGGDDLGEGGEIVDGVGGAGFQGGDQGAVSVGFDEGFLLVVEKEDGARGAGVGDGLFDGVVDAADGLCVPVGLSGGDAAEEKNQEGEAEGSRAEDGDWHGAEEGSGPEGTTGPFWSEFPFLCEEGECEGAWFPGGLGGKESMGRVGMEEGFEEGER